MASCLILDEAPVIRKVAARVLLQIGLSVESVGTPEEARRWFQGNGLPDILLVGAAAGDDRSIQLISEVRAMPLGKGVMILALIVGRDLGLMTRLHRAGVNDFIDKPFERASMEEWIRPYVEAVETTEAA